MDWCPVCSKQFSTNFALNGHKRLSTDQKHVSYSGKPPLKRRYIETQQKKLQRRLKQQIEENKTLKSLLNQKNKDGSDNNEKVIHQETEQGNEKVIDLITKLQEDFNMFSEFIKEKIDQKETPRPTETTVKPSVPSTLTHAPKTSQDQMITPPKTSRTNLLIF